MPIHQNTKLEAQEIMGKLQDGIKKLVHKYNISQNEKEVKWIQNSPWTPDINFNSETPERQCNATNHNTYSKLFSTSYLRWDLNTLHWAYYAPLTKLPKRLSWQSPIQGTKDSNRRWNKFRYINLKRRQYMKKHHHGGVRQTSDPWTDFALLCLDLYGWFELGQACRWAVSV